MKRFIRNITILISPFLIMIMVNEIIRLTINEKPYSIFEVPTMNSVDNISDKCTWACFNNSTFCQENHVKYLKPYYKYTDDVYFGIINGLKLTVNYRLANIIILVILIPLFIWFFTIKSLNLQDKIKKLKNE